MLSHNKKNVANHVFQCITYTPIFFERYQCMDLNENWTCYSLTAPKCDLIGYELDCTLHSILLSIQSIHLFVCLHVAMTFCKSSCKCVNYCNNWKVEEDVKKINLNNNALYEFTTLLFKHFSQKKQSTKYKINLWYQNITDDWCIIRSVGWVLLEWFWRCGLLTFWFHSTIAIMKTT